MLWRREIRQQQHQQHAVSHISSTNNIVVIVIGYCVGSPTVPFSAVCRQGLCCRYIRRIRRLSDIATLAGRTRVGVAVRAVFSRRRRRRCGVCVHYANDSRVHVISELFVSRAPGR